MSKYRSIMATTVDCDGCCYDSDYGCSAEYCIILDHKKEKHETVRSEEEVVKNILNIISDGMSMNLQERVDAYVVEGEEEKKKHNNK